MSERHPAEAEFERYIDGAAGDWRAFEAHVAGCSACAERLTSEAAADMALYVALRERARRQRRTSVRRATWAGAFAAAAGVALVLWSHASAPPPSRPFEWVQLPGAVSPDEVAQESDFPTEVIEVLAEVP